MRKARRRRHRTRMPAKTWFCPRLFQRPRGPNSTNHQKTWRVRGLKRSACCASRFHFYTDQLCPEVLVLIHQPIRDDFVTRTNRAEMTLRDAPSGRASRILFSHSSFRTCFAAPRRRGSARMHRPANFQQGRLEGISTGPQAFGKKGVLGVVDVAEGRMASVRVSESLKIALRVCRESIRHRCHDNSEACDK